MTLGKNIRLYRKKRHLTQELLANKLNISSGAVSKWETGMSLPDTELLVPLADSLQVTLDELFGFSLTLSEERLQAIKEEIVICFKDSGFVVGMQLIEAYLHEFPHSETLIYQSAHLIWTYSLLLPFKDEIEVVERRNKAFELYQRLFDSGNELMRLNALYTGAVILMSNDRVEELEELLKRIPTADYDTFYMSLHVLEKKKEYIEARELSLRKLFGKTNELSSLLAIVGRLYETTGDGKQAAVYFELLEKLEKLFRLITPSVAMHRKVRKLMEEGRRKEAAVELKKMFFLLCEQPLDWQNHFLFASIQLSADEEKQKQIRRLYLNEMLNEFKELAEYPEYAEAEKRVSEYG